MSHEARSQTILFDRILQASKYDIRTHVIAQVVSYDAETNLCVCQPVTKAIRITDAANPEYIQLGTIGDVPVALPGSGKLWCAFAPQVDTYGLLHISDRIVDTWLELGGIVEPKSIRCFDLSDAIFYPSIVPLVVDGDNGAFEEQIKTDRISLRTRSGLTEISVLDDESISVNVNDGKATLTIDSNGNVTLETEGNISAESTGGDLTVTADGDSTVEAGGNVELDNGSQSVTVGSSSVDVGSGTDFVAMATKVDTLWTTLYTLLTTWVPVPTDGGAAFKTAAIAAFPTPPSSVASGNLKAE